MPTRERRLKLLAKQQHEAGNEADEPKNTTARKGKTAKGPKTKRSKKQAAAATDEGSATELEDGEAAPANSDGQQYLDPEFAPKKNKKIEKLALDYEQKRDSRMAQTKLEVAARKLLIEVLHENIDELFTDEDGRKIYKFPGEDKQVVLDTTEKVSVKGAKSDDEEVY